MLQNISGKIIIGITILCYGFSVNAQQENDSLKNINLNQIIISGNKFAEKKKNIIQKIDIISTKEIAQMNAQNMADVLINTGKIFVQKSQQGGGSPVIRGFEANRIQLNIDGIRFNNAISRGGHMQNVISMDNQAVQHVEVLYGPASTVHGSDALGGVILLKTKDPKFGDSKKISLNGYNALLRGATVNKEKTVSVGFTFGNDKIASLTQISFSDYDDLVQGKNGTDSIINLWKKKFVITNANGVDTMIENKNPYKQIASGYSQIDLLQKISFKPKENKKHTLNFQFSNSSNIPRYDRLTETSNGIAKNAEWYYGPQLRTLAAYQYDANFQQGIIHDINININHQFWEESRHNRSYKKEFLNHRTEKIHVAGFNLAMRNKQPKNEFTFGFDAQSNFLKSTAYATSIINQIQKKIDTRYPDGKNNMNLFGIFFQHIAKLYNDKIVINDGIRLNATTLHSTLVDTTTLFHLPFTTLTQNNKAITGNVGAAYITDVNLRYSINFSTGFRSPNIDDVTKIFESVSGERLMVPNTKLKPEFSKNIDAGITYNNGKLNLEAFGFFTHFTNIIVSDEFLFNGFDSVVYNGFMTKVYANQNKGKAFIYGGGLIAGYRFNKMYSINSNVNYTYGRVKNETTLTPLDHIPPITGKINFKYEQKKWYAEMYSIFNGEKSLKNYNPNGEDNLQYATPNGTLGWFTLNCKGGFFITKKMQIQLGIENIADKNYRYFASGISAPGRNFILAFRTNN